MKKAIIGRKLGMTQVFSEEGLMIPVTVIEAGPCTVIQKKTEETDGYNALQVGFGDIREKLVSKPLQGHFEKAGVDYKRILKEFRLEDISEYEVGSEIKADIFEAGDKVDVSGHSKGKGFQGSIKRHGQSRGPMSHGSKYHRGVGGLAGSASPGKVRKGRPMPGHMGSENVTVQNLEIVRVLPEENVLLIKGAVPGIRGAFVYIKDTVKA